MPTEGNAGGTGVAQSATTRNWVPGGERWVDTRRDHGM